MSDVTKMPALELPGAGKHGSGSGGRDGYKVEVRTSYIHPTVLDDFVIDGTWRTLPIKRSMTPWGINIPVNPFDADMVEHGLLPYEAVQTHRWAFLALLAAQHVAGSLCIQTRLVKVAYSYTFKTEEIGVSEYQEGRSFDRDVKPFKPRFSTEIAKSSD